MGSGATSCSSTTCAAGKFKTGGGCQDCFPGQYTEAAHDTSSCKSCPTGYQSQAGASQCTSTTCAAGEYKNQNTGTCFPCPTGYTSQSGATSCSSTTCAAGKFKTGGTCQDCQP